MKYNDDGTPQDMPPNTCVDCGWDTFEVGLIGRADCIPSEVTHETITVWDITSEDVEVDDMAVAICMNCGRTYEVITDG